MSSVSQLGGAGFLLRRGDNDCWLNLKRTLAAATDDSAVSVAKLPCFCIDTKGLF